MRIKKYIRISAVILIMLISLPAAAKNEITVYVNNKTVVFDTPPFIEQERTLVPIRAITEAMGFDVEWNKYDRTAVISNSAKSVSVTVDSNYIDVYDYGNGTNKVVYIDVPAAIKNSRTYIPLRAVSEAFDAEVQWFGTAGMITIDYNPPAETSHETVDYDYEPVTEKNPVTDGDTAREPEINSDTDYNTVKEPENTDDEIGNNSEIDNYEDWTIPDGYDEPKEVFNLEEYVGRVIDLVNEERANVGLPELKEDKRLDAVAQGHSEDMAENDFFDHTNLQGKSPFDRLSDNNIRFMAAGENIAWGHTSPEEVVEGWMESTGHRENILSENFGKIGVGIAESSYNTFYWTQVFTD